MLRQEDCWEFRVNLQNGTLFEKKKKGLWLPTLFLNNFLTSFVSYWEQVSPVCTSCSSSQGQDLILIFVFLIFHTIFIRSSREAYRSGCFLRPRGLSLLNQSHPDATYSHHYSLSFPINHNSGLFKLPTLLLSNCESLKTLLVCKKKSTTFLSLLVYRRRHPQNTSTHVDSTNLTLFLFHSCIFFSCSMEFISNWKWSLLKASFKVLSLWLKSWDT